MAEKPSQEGIPAVYEWLGKAVIVSYTGGPAAGDPLEIEKGSLEGRTTLALLMAVDYIGIMASRLAEEKQGDSVDYKWDEPFFIPWASVLSIRLLRIPDQSDEGEGRAKEE